MSPFTVFAVSTLVCAVAFSAQVDGHESSRVDEVREKLSEYWNKAANHEQKKCLVKVTGKSLVVGNVLNRAIKNKLNYEDLNEEEKAELKSSLKADLKSRLEQAGVTQEQKDKIKEKAKEWAHEKKSQMDQCLQQ